MNQTYDVVVVGGGSNSLTAAAFLAKIGKKVLVIEKNDHCGGGVVSMSPAPGFINDPHAVAMVTAVANPVIAADELGLQKQFGLQWFYGDTPFSTVFDDGSGLSTHRDLDATCHSIAKFSERDAVRYREFVAECREYLPLILKGYYTPPLPFGGFIALLEQNSRGRKLVTAMLDSAYDVVDALFESPELKMHILKWAGELMVHPETKGTGLIPYMLMGFSHQYRMAGVVGGTVNLTNAILRCIEHYGGKIRLNSEVVKINLSGGRATGVTLQGGEVINAKDAVVANIHPWDLGLFLEGLDPALVEAARNVKLSSHGAINQQIALSEPPVWKAGAEYAPSMLVECIQRNMNGMRAKFDEYKYGRMTRENLSPLISVQSNHDKTRCPPGKATLYLYHFAPLVLEQGGLEGWDAIKQEVGGWVFDDMCRYTTNMDRSKILGWHIESPLDHHRHSRMMRMGDIFGCGTFTSQFLGRRPIPELAQYKVPGIESFYLTGSTQHPGGTVTLGGRATVMKMMMDWKIDLKKAFITI